MKNLNYYSTFIEVSEDCPATKAEIPVIKGQTKTVPYLQYELIANHPYRYTQEEILFEVYALRNNIEDDMREKEKERFFSKGQACLRASSLCKRYGWGIHHDSEGKVALYPVESEEYSKFKNDPGTKSIKGMRTSRA